MSQDEEPLVSAGPSDGEAGQEQLWCVFAKTDVIVYLRVIHTRLLATVDSTCAALEVNIMDRSDMAIALRSIANALPNASTGLPDPVFDFILSVTPMINVDLLIRDETGRHLLIWRDDECGSGWHVPGGIIRFQETASHRIAEVARAEIGALVKASSLPCAVTEFLDEPRGHFISLLFPCNLVSDIGFKDRILLPGSNPRKDTIAWIKGVPDDMLPVHRRYAAWLESGGKEVGRAPCTQS